MRWLGFALGLGCTCFVSSAMAQNTAGYPPPPAGGGPPPSPAEQAAPQQAYPQQQQQGYPQQGAPQGAPPPVAGSQPGWGGNGAPNYAMPAPLPSLEPQERTANNAIYIELLGAGFLYSINYERTFGDFAARAGFGYWSISADSDTGVSFLAVPLTLSFIGVGSKRHMLELGAGATIYHLGGRSSSWYFDSSGSDTVVVPMGFVGYRLQPPDGGFFLRTGLNGLVFSGEGFFVWPYVGLGGTF
jgi:hypothetical protein